ncbi:MAG: NAD(P)-binding domain-containing protein [Cyanothece sp. SIO1E1]|nr:NAD(P)-binding domain-containing protein [Cyanothece sp. SIO1E1]
MLKYLIIGAGPAGLATAVALKKAAIPFEMVDAGQKVGGIWDIERGDTPMYDSAHFISSKTLSGFEDFPMPKDYPDYPSHRLVQAYLEAYATHHGLAKNIQFRTSVETVESQGTNWKVAFAGREPGIYQGVICATGITWHQNLPSIEGNFDGTFLHSFDYRDTRIFEGKRVLIIGGGNSGCDIACDAARVAEKAFISLRRGYYFLPKYTLGMPSDLFKHQYKLPSKYLDKKVSEWLLNKVLVGNLENYGLPKPDHGLMESHPIMNSRLLHYLGHGDIVAKKDVATFAGNTVVFTDGTTEQIDVVIAATGYKRAFPFLAESLVPKTEGKQEIDLYLEVFSKQYDNLFFVGGIEVASAVFGLFSLQGALIAAYLKARKNSSNRYQRFLSDKRTKQVNLTGKNKYIASMRHQRYVDKALYQKILQQQLKSFQP